MNRFQYEDINWKELPGNKLSLALKPAMPTEHGHIASQRVKVKAKPARMCRVNYDRDYVVTWLASKVISPLGIHGKLALVDLLDEAWELHFKDELKADDSNDSDVA